LVVVDRSTFLEITNVTFDLLYQTTKTSQSVESRIQLIVVVVSLTFGLRRMVEVVVGAILQLIWDEIGIRGEMLKLNTAVC